MDPMTRLDVGRVDSLRAVLDPIGPLMEDLGAPVHSTLGDQQVVDPDDQPGFAVVDMRGDDGDIAAGSLADANCDLGLLGVVSQRRPGSVETVGQSVVAGVDCASDVAYLGL